MRLKTAAALLLLGLVALVAGIGQLTWWAPADQVTATVPAGTPATPLTVIDAKLKDLRGGEATLTVHGNGNYVLAAARPDDMAAWVGKAAHTTIDGASDDGKVLKATHTDGEATSPNPAGADLFATSQNANGTLQYHWDLPDSGDWQLLLATDGKAPAPQDVTITWPSHATMPWAVPLIVIGALLILAAAALMLLRRLRGGPGAPRIGGPDAGGPGTDGEDRRRAPEAGASGPATAAIPPVPGQAPGTAERTADRRAASLPAVRRTPAARVAAVLSVLLGVGGLAAVPAQAATAPAPSPAESGTRVVVEDQLTRILDQTANAVQAGDDAKDAGKLGARVDGSALLARQQNYKVRAAVSSAPAIAPVRSSKLLTTVVTTQRSWPRTIVAVTQGQGNTTPQLLTLRQASARENYKLIEAAPLLPGATFPGTPKSGTDQIALDDKAGLTVSPKDAIAGVADRLSNANSAWKGRIPDNAYIKDTFGYQSDIAKAADATFTFKHTPVGNEAAAFRAADGGAIVVAPLDFTVEGTPKASGDKVTLQDDAAALAGGKEASTKATLTFRESVMLYIPKDGGPQQVTLIGATRNLSGASVS
ncbi:hypothetical protein SAT01_14510 [Sinomonas atrocyanea]|uniref:hypothetical protein n=1 Tax=Sinomonas atrocyanea TaxID=37927 RepID=UPI001143DBF6|nr:hypothetical protein [Sinomonas atrocyanea]GEB64003.1 hypothetical protein SAT01_14510 [Sinomonas atrocyanea]